MRTTLGNAFAAFFLTVATACGAAAQDWRDLARPIPGRLQALQNDLSVLKADMLSYHEVLKRQVQGAQEQFASWDRNVRLESNATLRATMALHRDGFNLHADSLRTLHETFVDLGRLGQALESDQGHLRLVQQTVESNGAARRSAQSSDFELVRLLIQGLIVRQQHLQTIFAAASRRTASLKDHDREVRALLSGIGSSGDRLKQFERMMVETELERIEMEKRHLVALGRFGARMSDIIEKIGDTLRAQERALRAI